MSRSAKRRLREARVRQLLRLELGADLRFDKQPTGPLGADIVRVWIDLLKDDAAAIEVRRNGLTTAKRTLSLRNFANDVAARVVSIAAAEMIRVQAKHRSQSDGHAENLSRRELPQRPAPTLSLETTLGGQWVDGSQALWLGGSGLAVQQSGRRLGASAFGRWLAGAGTHSATRWFEFGLGMHTHWRPWSDWQLQLGTEGSAIALRNQTGTVVENEWSATASLRLRLLHRIEQGLWVGLSLRPGLILRPVDFRVADVASTPSTGAQTVGGATVALGATVRWHGLNGHSSVPVASGANPGAGQR